MAEAGDLTVDLTGVLAAPRAPVFELLTEPDELARWWGPSGFTCPSVEVDLRVGGGYRIAMQPPDGDLSTSPGSFSTSILPPRSRTPSAGRIPIRTTAKRWSR